MRQAVIELDLEYEIVHLDGYLFADDYLVAIEDDVMWLYNVRKKDDSDAYVSDRAGLWLGRLSENEKVDHGTLVALVIDFIRNMSLCEFLRNYHDWTVDYEFTFVEAVS